jgi:hypothetical protein
MSDDVIDFVVARRLAETGFPEEPGNCVAYRSAVYEINYGDMTADCTLCGASPETHDEDPNEAAHPWPGPRSLA